MNLKHVIGYSATAIVGIGIGAAATAGDGDVTAPVAAVPTVTVTAPAPDSGPLPTITETVEVPGPEKTVTAPPPPPAVAIPGDGTYEVGVDVKPGTYVSTAPDSGNCYYARLSGTDGFDDIITNGNSSGQSVVTIKKTDKFFETSGCNAWTKR